MGDNRGIQIGALWMAGVMLVVAKVCAADTIYTKDNVGKFQYLYPAVSLSEHTMFSSDFCEQILALNFSVPSYTNELNKSKLSLLYLSALLILQSADTEVNPGPRGKVKYPCGQCQRAVKWNDARGGIFCEGCRQWFHADCEGMSRQIYEILGSTDISWICINCAMPNFSSALFDLSSYDLSNNFSVLSEESSPPRDLGDPQASSSPKSRNRNIKAPRLVRVINVNFQSLVNKKAELASVINDTKPDIIIGTETWLTPEVSSYEYFQNDKYTVYRKDRSELKIPNMTDKSHGGVLIAVSNDFASSMAVELDTDTESIWARIKSPNSNDLYIGSVYRSDHEQFDIKLQMSDLRESLNRIGPNTNARIILGGDFNLPYIDWNTQQVIDGNKNKAAHTELLEIMHDFALEQSVTNPTRDDATLDLIFTNRPSKVNRIETMPPMGDHDIVFMEIDLSVQRLKQKPRRVYHYKSADWKSFLADLSKFRQEIQNENDLDPNSLWQKFSREIEILTNKHIKSKTLSQKFCLPWLTRPIKTLINKRNKAHSNWKRSHSEQHHQKLKSLRAKVQYEIRRAYWEYINKIVSSEEDDLEHENRPKFKKFYQFIKSLKRDSINIPPIKNGEKLETETAGKANALNNQFQSVFVTEGNAPMHDKGPSPHKQMPKFDIDINGVTKLLQNLNIHKASGPDNVNARILKELHSETAPILTFIFKRSFETGIVPDDWKKANVVPIFKKGERYKASNYRPVSLTCISCKVMEHIIASQVMKHLESNDILYEKQFGFRGKRSPETQLVQLIDDLAAGVKDKHQTDVAIMDFSKAFDTVPHKRLLHKLEYYGIEHQTRKWVEGFLKDRTQKVLINGESSDEVPVASGVPQGSVLGPVLFLIYINDLPDYVQNSTVRLFADDCILYRQIETRQDCIMLQADLKNLETWEQHWLMSFNAAKCSVMSVTLKRNIILHDYVLHNDLLDRVTSTKYLGVTIESKLKWHIHVNEICKKANKTLGLLKRNLKVASPKLKEKAYHTLVRPVLEYSCTAWDPYQAGDINKIEMVQRRAARYTLNRYHNRSSVTDMLNHLEWPTLSSRREQFKLCMVYKAIHNYTYLPINRYLNFSPIATPHQYKLMLPYTRVDCYHFSFFPSVVRPWNSLPVSVVLAPNYEAFKAGLRAHAGGAITD